MELKEGNRVMVSGDSNAVVEYYFGCDHAVQGNEIYIVDAEDCCLTLVPLDSIPIAIAVPPPGTK